VFVPPHLYVVRSSNGMALLWRVAAGAQSQRFVWYTIQDSFGDFMRSEECQEIGRSVAALS